MSNWDKDILRMGVICFCVVAGIVAVYFIHRQTMTVMSQGSDANQIKEYVGMAGTAITMIGTLVGFVAGQAAGATGKEKSDERAAKAETRAAVIGGMSPPDVVKQAMSEHPDLFQ